MDDVFAGLSEPTRIDVFRVQRCRVTGQTIQSIAALMPRVYSLHLVSSNDTVTDILELEMRKFRATTDASFASIATHLPDLRTLNVVISASSSISNASLVALANGCTELGALTFTGSCLITDDAVRTLGTRCRKLSHLDVTSCLRLTDRAFDTLNFSIVYLLEVSGTRVTGAFHAGMFLEEKAGRLPVFFICNRCTNLTAVLVKFVGSRKSIFALSLVENHLPRDALLALAQSCADAKVVSLDLSWSAHADNELLETFRNLNPQLQGFKVEGCGTA